MSVSSPSANLSISCTIRIRIMAIRKEMVYLLFWCIFLSSFVASQDHGSNSTLIPHNPEDSTADGSVTGSKPGVTSLGPASDHQSTPSVLTTLPGTPPTPPTTEGIITETDQPSRQPSSSLGPTETSHEPASTAVTSTNGPSSILGNTTGHLSTTSRNVSPNGPFSSTSTIGIISANESTSTTDPIFTTESTSTVGPTNESTSTTDPIFITESTSTIGPTNESTSTIDPIFTTESTSTIGPTNESTSTTDPIFITESTSTIGPTNESTSTIDPISTAESTTTIGPTSESTSIMGPTSESTYTIGPVSTSETVSTIGPISTSESVSTTAIFTTANTTFSNSSLGILFHRIPKRNNLLPTLTTTTSTKKTSHDKAPAGGGVLPCTPKRREGLVSQCLIAIASLAGLATIFMVSTIVLCTKLSSRKHMYKVRQAEQGTEMVCISALLSESHVPLRRSQIHQTNRSLLAEDNLDSDEDTGDDLTLNSFFQDSERNV